MHALVSWMEYQLFPDADQWMVSVNSDYMHCHQCAHLQCICTFEVVSLNTACGRKHE